MFGSVNRTAGRPQRQALREPPEWGRSGCPLSKVILPLSSLRTHSLSQHRSISQEVDVGKEAGIAVVAVLHDMVDDAFRDAATSSALCGDRCPDHVFARSGCSAGTSAPGVERATDRCSTLGLNFDFFVDRTLSRHLSAFCRRGLHTLGCGQPLSPEAGRPNSCSRLACAPRSVGAIRPISTFVGLTEYNPCDSAVRCFEKGGRNLFDPTRCSILERVARTPRRIGTT